MDPRDSLRWLASRLPASLVALLRYRREAAFIEGRRAFESGERSVIFFTVRKCASTMMRHLLADIARRHLDLTPLNLVGYLWDTTAVADVYVHLDTNAHSLFRERGILYGPLRRYVEVSHLREARVMAMLRDPRDVVVSSYFSARYSHRAPSNSERKARFEARRQAMTDIQFETWVRQEAQRVKSIYAGYRGHLDRSCVLTYEEMWADFDAWLERLGLHLGVRFSPADNARYRVLAGVEDRRVENVRSHRRKGTPGDYAEKLSEPLAEELTVLFRDELDWLYGKSDQPARPGYRS